MDKTISLRKNPSRENCEKIIKRILATEILEHGQNLHFKQASDFMNYFQSLYPASDSLTKQVQRAVKSMDMPKDENGFFIPNKTAGQLAHEKELQKLLQQSLVSVNTLENCEPFLLVLEPDLCDYAIRIIENCETFRGKYETVFRVHNGLLFYTKNRNQLNILFESLI